MHDEATSHYIDMIDQTTLGHLFIKNQFNKVPRAGWQIDPFGHSAVQAYLLGAELGFESIHFARIDYQDRTKRKLDKTLEVVWRGSKTFGSSVQIFANTFPVHYSPPSGFHFEVGDNFVPLQDDPLLFDYNVEQRVQDFINAAITQANVTRTNHIMWTMGDDFQYQYAESWFKQMDKLIHHVNKDGRVNALYSTPSIYTDAKNAANQTWPLKIDDYFPYADEANAYWTGYFTSRPAFKRYVRILSGYYLAARQLGVFAGKKFTVGHTSELGDALGIAQHHDAVSGTARQHTTDDYAKRLAIGASRAETIVRSSLYCLTNKKSWGQCSAPASFAQCQLLNISYCPQTEDSIPQAKSLVVVVYNSLGWNRTDIVRVPVNEANLVVKDSLGYNVQTQYIEVDNVTTNLREVYVNAYVGLPPKQAPKYWLLFQVSVPPLGWNTYFISKAAREGKSRNEISSQNNDIIEAGQGNLKLSFSLESGQLIRMHNTRTGVSNLERSCGTEELSILLIHMHALFAQVDVPIQQSYLWYRSSGFEGQASGAYIFRPNSSPNVVSRSVPFKIIRGPLVDEIHQKFSSWIYQVTRVYKDKEHAEIEYTLNLGIYIKDKKSELSVLVDRATGGASIKDGQMELMLHRRLLYDDGRGVGEALDEQVCVKDGCQGLTVRGNYYVGIHNLGAGSRWRRTIGQEIYSPLLLAFTHEYLENWKYSHLAKGTVIDPNYTLPLNVALITLEELDNGSVLLRLAHLYEPGEDAQYSTLAKVELKKMFVTKTIKELNEVSLSANQEKSKMKNKTWKVEGDKGQESQAVRGGPVSNITLVVELGPMEIRTFLLKF
ncbi:hypothetical protein RJT34_06033 [Clitoria ternatea]|uniref:Alpha-mannosidase n=1 Tax=Clitoria ternatea TaxID=43366 RepID=A0AAN9K574_CLITE